MSKEVMTPQEQASLAGRLRARDADAERELLARFERPLLMIMRARTRDVEAARELVQDVLVAVVQAIHAGQVRDDERLAAFVHGTARNIANNYLRARRRRPAEDPLPDDLPRAAPPDDFARQQQWAFLRRALARLSPVDRRILLMSLVQGVNPADIGARLGLSAQFVRTRKSRAVKKLIDLIANMTRRASREPLSRQERS